MRNKNGANRDYYLYRIRLEKLKQKTWGPNKHFHNASDKFYEGTEMKLRRIIAAALLLLNSRNIFAEEECAQEEPKLREQVLSLVNDLNSGKRTDIDTVDSFLGALPKEARSRYLFMTGSRSLQGSTMKDPRVILSSPKAEVSLSFTSDPNSTGFERVEMMLWNAKKSEFEFIDLRFPKDAGEKESIKPEVTHNPDSCLRCHGTPPRPNFDTTNFWFGLTPFNQDTVCGNTHEAQNFVSFMDRIEKKEPRYRHLEIPAVPYSYNGEIESSDPSRLSPKTTSVSEMRKVASSPKGRLIFRGADPGEPPFGVGFGYFHRLDTKNKCRVGEDIKKNKYYNNYRYALFALAKATECRNFPDNMDAKTRDFSFLPDWAIDRAVQYYNAQGIPVHRNGKNVDLNALEENTENRMTRYFEDRVSRQREFFKTHLGNKEGEEEFKKIQACNPVQNRDAEFNQYAFRFLLEPFETSEDVKMNSWAMSIDPASYTFGEGFGGGGHLVEDVMAEFEQDKKLGRAKDVCEWAKQKSLGAFNRPSDLRTKVANDYTLCPFDRVPTNPAENFKPLEKLGLTILREQVRPILLRSCVACHQTGGPLNAPKIDMVDLDAFEKLISSTAGQHGTDWSQRIWSRINRAPEDHGRMPKIFPALPKDEREIIKNYLNFVRTTANPEARGVTNDL